MTTIHKYPLEITDVQLIPAPFGAKAIHVGLDPSGTPCLWAIVEDHIKQGGMDVWIVGTGQEIPKEDHAYVGSFVQGPFVWHVFVSQDV
jgi:hypothetical protein